MAASQEVVTPAAPIAPSIVLVLGISTDDSIDHVTLDLVSTYIGVHRLKYTIMVA